VSAQLLKFKFSNVSFLTLFEKSRACVKYPGFSWVMTPSFRSFLMCVVNYMWNLAETKTSTTFITSYKAKWSRSLPISLCQLPVAAAATITHDMFVLDLVNFKTSYENVSRMINTTDLFKRIQAVSKTIIIFFAPTKSQLCFIMHVYLCMCPAICIAFSSTKYCNVIL